MIGIPFVSASWQILRTMVRFQASFVYIVSASYALDMPRVLDWFGVLPKNSERTFVQGYVR
jgi:hypothetical protein